MDNRFVTLSDFMEDPVGAMADGYKACYLDHCAMWCKTISFKTCKKLARDWAHLFTRYSLMELPKAIAVVACVSMVWVSMPLIFWMMGIISYFTYPKYAVKRQKKIQRAYEDLSS